MTSYCISREFRSHIDAISISESFRYNSPDECLQFFFHVDYTNVTDQSSVLTCHIGFDISHLFWSGLFSPSYLSIGL